MSPAHHQYMQPAANERQIQLFKGAMLLAYVIAAHTIDTLALRNVEWLLDWHVFRIQAENGFDAFKFTVWLVIPLVVFFPTLDVHYFTLRRWRRCDYAVLLAMVLLAIAVVAVIPFVPGLRDAYPRLGDLPGPARVQFLLHQVTWTFSWLVGWEFLHRYVLLTRLRSWWRPGAWVAVPAIEGLYHVIQGKHWLESVGVVIFSVVACGWTIKRRNALLPFLAHLMIELALIGFLLTG